MKIICLSISFFLLFDLAKITLAFTTVDLHQAAADALHAKDYKLALDFLSQAIEIDPQDASLLNTIGVVFDATGDVDRAAEFFASSLKIDPSSFSTNYNAANLMHYGVFDKNASNSEALDSSVIYYSKAYEILITSGDNISKGEEFRFLTDAGIAMMKASKYIKAVQLFTKILALDPNNFHVMSDLSLAYLGSGDVKSAQHFSSMAIERSPSNAKILRNRALIERNASLTEQRDESFDQENMDEIVFSTSLVHQEDESDLTYNIRIELKRSDDIVALLNELHSQLTLNLVTYKWLHSSLHHSLARLNEDMVFETPVDLDGRDLPPIRVHFGDDLLALSKSYSHKHGLTDDVANVIYGSLADRVPQHSEVEWVNARKRQLYKTAKTQTGRDYMSVSRNNRVNSNQCMITYAIVTTGSLKLFYNLITKLPTANNVCDVVVLDYLLNDTDKTKIMRDFPQFDFVFIAKRDQGHVISVSKILTIVKTPYVLYLSDNWEPIGDCSDKIDKAYLLMEATMQLGMPIAQVLMNEQSSRECTFGLELSKCREKKFYGRSGWSRRVTVDTLSIDFIEHEFGVQYNEHQQTASWPGFSSQYPALWNLNLLTSSNANLFYNEDRTDYDLIFALKVLESGMTVAHLPDVGFSYIGK